jgi:hypothetical protein
MKTGITVRAAPSAASSAGASYVRRSRRNHSRAVANCWPPSIAGAGAAGGAQAGRGAHMPEKGVCAWVIVRLWRCGGRGQAGGKRADSARPAHSPRAPPRRPRRRPEDGKTGAGPAPGTGRGAGSGGRPRRRRPHRRRISRDAITESGPPFTPRPRRARGWAPWAPPCAAPFAHRGAGGLARRARPGSPLRPSPPSPSPSPRQSAHVTRPCARRDAPWACPPAPRPRAPPSR